MAVFRVHKTKDFTVMSNHHLRDRNLTLKAKGLLSVILSLPDDWKYSIAGLAAICKEGTSAVKSALQELTEAGYVTVTKLYPNQTETGRIEYVYDIHETPQAPRKQGIENQPLEVQQVENRGQLNTDVPSTNKPNTKNNPKKERKKPSTFDAIIAERTDNPELANAIGEFIRMRQRIKKPLTDYALKMRLDKLWKIAETDAERILVVQQSIGACWQDFYPLKDDDKKRKPAPTTLSQETIHDLGFDERKATSTVKGDGYEEVWY